MNDQITSHDNRFAITADYLLFLLCSFKFTCILNFSQVISSHEIESCLLQFIETIMVSPII